MSPTYPKVHQEGSVYRERERSELKGWRKTKSTWKKRKKTRAHRIQSGRIKCKRKTCTESRGRFVYPTAHVNVPAAGLIKDLWVWYTYFMVFVVVVIFNPPFPLDLRKDFPVVPRSTVRQRACSTPFSGEGRGLRGSPETVGSPFSCENRLSPQELLRAPPAHYTLAPPHMQHSHQPQVYCTKRKGRRTLQHTVWQKDRLSQAVQDKKQCHEFTPDTEVQKWPLSFLFNHCDTKITTRAFIDPHRYIQVL